MTTFVIALISFAVAFVTGGILSKAYFAVRGTGDSAAMNEQRRRYRKRLDALQTVIRCHEDAQEQVKKKLQNFQAMDASAEDATKTGPEVVELRRAAKDLRNQASSREREIESLRERTESAKAEASAEKDKAESAQNELSLLRIERDELLARIRRHDSEQHASSKQSSLDKQDQTHIAAGMRAEMGEMRESLATRDRQVHDLELQLKERSVEIESLLERLESLKQRVSPLTKKLKQQRNLIREFREIEATAVVDDSGRGNSSAQPGDNLKKIHGIGPALERRLYRHGIRTFEQIAELSNQELAKIAAQLAIAPQLAQRDRWIEQARELVSHQATTA